MYPPSEILSPGHFAFRENLKPFPDSLLPKFHFNPSKDGCNRKKELVLLYLDTVSIRAQLNFFERVNDIKTGVKDRIFTLGQNNVKNYPFVDST